MKVLLSWLREFVDVPGSPEEIAAKMSVRGFAVEGIDHVDADPSPTADAVLDFQITANRPDCMSVRGMAREVATAYGLALRDTPASQRPAANSPQSAEARSPKPESRTPNPESRAPNPESRSHSPAVDIVIDDPALCPRYVGALADVTVGQSPEWLQA